MPHTRLALGSIDMAHYRVPDKFVCSACIDDYAIKEFINEYAIEQECSYCAKKSSRLIAAPLEDVIAFMLKGIWTEWDEPNNCMSWDEDWVGAEVIDSDELIRYRVGLESSNEEVLDDIILTLTDLQWCQRDPYGLPDDEKLIFGWHTFCEQVKHHTRYIFFLTKNGEDGEEERFYDRDNIPVHEMIGRISYEISMLERDIDIVKVLPTGTRLWRVRIDEKDFFDRAADVGTVPSHKAKYSNRMSPAGIPMFYGAFDPTTALKETIGRQHKLGQVASIGTFESLREVKVLDLSQLPKTPSLFDAEKRPTRSSLIFLHNFVTDLSQPTTGDDLEHIDYVPTQMFTEYIRHLYIDDEGDYVLGIIYPSANNSGGKSIVLFLENEHCCDEKPTAKDVADENPPRYLILEAAQKHILTTSDLNS